MGTYQPLLEHLCQSADQPVEMTFEQIEGLLGPFPPSATRYAAWWSNERQGSRHVQASAWLDAGREVECVDLMGRRVRFSAPTWRRGS